MEYTVLGVGGAEMEMRRMHDDVSKSFSVKRERKDYNVRQQ